MILCPFTDEKEFQNFVNYASKLDAMEFMGLVRMLNVDIFKNAFSSDFSKANHLFDSLLTRAFL